MRIDVRMPQFGESAAEATVVAWLVKPGETILGVTEYTVRAADEAACADIEAAE